jgi:hypothetical protein
MLHKETKAFRLHVESDSCMLDGLVPVTYSRKERVEEFGCVGNKMLVVLKDGQDGKHSVFPNK